MPCHHGRNCSAKSAEQMAGKIQPVRAGASGVSGNEKHPKPALAPTVSTNHESVDHLVQLIRSETRHSFEVIKGFEWSMINDRLSQNGAYAWQ